MTTTEKQFAQTVSEHKDTIYTVCYMFSQDTDEVNDLFQETLVNLWKGFSSFEHRSDINLFEDQDKDTRQVDMLHKRISKLQPFDRAIVLLWLENLSYEEIGQIVGISETNVSVRLYRIKEQLKKMSND